MKYKEQLKLEQFAKEVLRKDVIYHTKWYVITGPPSSGKTSVINELAKQKFKINPDISRIYIEEEIKKGKNIEEIRKKEDKFQRIIFLKMLKNTFFLPRDELIFFDYALPDNIAFQKMYGIKVNSDVIKSAKIFKYKKIFLMSPLPLKKDNIRLENKNHQKKLEELFEIIYQNLGYEINKIPVSTVEKRVENILANL